MRKSILLIIFSLLLLVAMGSPVLFLCAQSTEPSQDNNYDNFEFLIVPPDENVDIKIFIDDKLVLDGQYRETKKNDHMMKARMMGTVAESDFLKPGTNAGDLFKNLIENDYINTDGVIKRTFRELKSPSNMKLDSVYAVQKEKIYAILQQANKGYQFYLEPGKKHTLRAEAHQGKQCFTGEFEISNKRFFLNFISPQRINTKEPFFLEVYDHQIYDTWFNLELHVVTDENVAVKVFIDGKLALDEQFKKQKKEDFIGIAPHKIFRFNLKPGKHALRAEAHQGKQCFTGEFELSGKRWIALTYVDPQRIKQKEPFSLDVYDYQVRYQ